MTTSNGSLKKPLSWVEEIQLARELRSFAESINRNYPYSWKDSANYDYSDTAIYAPFIARIQQRDIKSVLICGAHQNGAIHRLAQTNPNVEFTCVDMNTKHVLAGTRLGRLNNLKFVQSRFSDYKPTEVFEAFYCFGVYSYVDEVERKALNRLLKNNVSRLACVTYEDPVDTAPWLEIRDFAKQLTSSKGRIKNVQDFVNTAKNYLTDPVATRYLSVLVEYPVLLKDVIYQSIFMPHRYEYMGRMMHQLGFNQQSIYDKNMSIRAGIWEVKDA